MMANLFPAPSDEPDIFMLHAHQHQWVEAGARLNPNGTWCSVWSCEVCPDMGLGGYIGPIPDGYCDRCGWVQKGPGREVCEECKQALGEENDE